MSPTTAGSASTPSSTDTPQTALDGGDGQDADKPPHGRSNSSRTTSSATTTGTSKTVTADPHVYQPRQRGPAPQNMPLSIRSASSSSDNARLFKISPPPSMPPSRPPSTPGSVFETESDSGSESDCEISSLPSTRANSRAASRAPSMSSAVPGSRLEALGKKEERPRLNTAVNGSGNHSHAGPQSPPAVTSPTKSSKFSTRPSAPSRTPSQSGSVRSEDAASHGAGQGQKFTLKDLLASAPKLTRRTSARSTGSSKKSDSDGERRSVAGESTTGSLGQKYGVCGKAAIGRGATSVVRLAHKWDRSEEKLYAIKVTCANDERCGYTQSLLLPLSIPFLQQTGIAAAADTGAFFSLSFLLLGIPQTPQERIRERVC
jgi:protein-serine/threonine kinase